MIHFLSPVSAPVCCTGGGNWIKAGVVQDPQLWSGYLSIAAWIVG
jgi:hypothetical protein